MCGGEEPDRCGIKKPWGTEEERMALALGRTHFCQGLHSLSWTDTGVSACKYKAYISVCTKICAGFVYNSRSKGSLLWIQSSVVFCFYSHHLTSLCNSSVPVSKVALIQFTDFFSSAQQLDALLTRTGNQSNGLCNSRMVSIIEKRLDTNYF